MQNEFPNANNVCYLNTGSEGLLPLRALRALQEAAEMKQKPQVLGDSQYFEMPERCRSLVAQMIHCAAEDIALIPSTSFGMSMMAHSLPLKPGDEVVIVEKDFPSNNFAWEPLRERGIKTRMVPFRADADQTGRVLESLTPPARVLSLSVVHFFTGFRYDLKLISEVCRQNNIFLIVDAIQAAGTIEINLEETHVDALCAAAHKWQLSPSGTGFLYVNPQLRSHLASPVSGWMHNKNARHFGETDMFTYEPASDTKRYELGTAPYILFAAYEQSLRLLLESRIPYIEDHNIRLAEKMKAFFRELGWKQPETPIPSPFCSVCPPEQFNTADILQRLAQQEVFVAVRANHLRMTPHLYNTDQHIDRFCEAMNSVIVKKG
jgi:cysteine desulfurase/selenocysteine lyase